MTPVDSINQRRPAPPAAATPTSPPPAASEAPKPAATRPASSVAPHPVAPASQARRPVAAVSPRLAAPSAPATTAAPTPHAPASQGPAEAPEVTSSASDRRDAKHGVVSPGPVEMGSATSRASERSEAKREVAEPISTPVGPSSHPTFDLPPAVYSPQLLESVMYDIQYYLDWIRQNEIRAKVGAGLKDEPNHSDETVLVIEAWLKGQPPTIRSIEELLDTLKKLKVPEIHVTLAALPNRTQRETLVKWLRSNTTPHLLVSFVADRNLGGGIVVRTPNRVFDYTWKQQVISNRDKLAGILKRV